MPEYYCDEQKFGVRLSNPICYTVPDPEAKQTISVSQIVFGIVVKPEKRWSPLCKKIFLTEKANALNLGGVWCPWTDNLSFINELPQCKSLTVGYQTSIDLSALASNPNIERLQLNYLGDSDPDGFDFTSLPNLSQCQITLHRNFLSVLKCALTQNKRHRRGFAVGEEKGSLTHGKKTPEKRCR